MFQESDIFFFQLEQTEGLFLWIMEKFISDLKGVFWLLTLKKNEEFVCCRLLGSLFWRDKNGTLKSESGISCVKSQIFYLNLNSFKNEEKYFYIHKLGPQWYIFILHDDRDILNTNHQLYFRRSNGSLVWLKIISYKLSEQS